MAFPSPIRAGRSTPGGRSGSSSRMPDFPSSSPAGSATAIAWPDTSRTPSLRAMPRSISPSRSARGTSYRLTQMECDLLRYLVTHAGQPVSRGAILENVWDLHEETDTRAIDNFIVRLRKYLEDRPDSPRFLQTVRGVGYKFVPKGKEA